MDRRGEITDDDRRLAAERSGLPEAAVYGISTFYDDLLQPRGERHIRVAIGRDYNDVPPVRGTNPNTGREEERLASDSEPFTAPGP